MTEGQTTVLGSIDERYVVEGDGRVYATQLSDRAVRAMIRFGTIIAVFRLVVSGIQYADVDLITHDVVWKSVKEE